MSVENIRVTGDTSSIYYKMGLAIKYDNDSPNYENCLVTLTPFLKNVGASVYRSQHVWYVDFFMDGNLIHQDNYTGPDYNNFLPNDTAQAGVVGTGKLYMQKNTWYQWGYSYQFAVPNDGSTHTFGLYMTCTTNPRYCPAQGALTTSPIQFYTYTPGSPPKPYNTTAEFNKETRVITYRWGDADCQYVRVYSRWCDADGNEIKKGYISVGSDDKLYNPQSAAGLVIETLPDSVCKVYYQVTNYYNTGTFTNDDVKVVNTVSDGVVYVNVNGVWKKATPWVKVDGVWKKANKTYVKVSNDWKQTIT